VPSLTRSRFCNFQFSWASPAQPFSSPTGLMSISYCLYFWDSSNLEGQVPVFISPRNRIIQLYTRALSRRWKLLYFLSECCYLKFAVLFLWGALSDDRTGLQFAAQTLNGPSRSKPVTILYCLIWDSPNLEGQVPVFISPRNRVDPVIPSGTGFSLRRLLRLASYDSQGYSGGILTLPLPGGTGPFIYM
jgi:hypothetical protein